MENKNFLIKYVEKKDKEVIIEYKDRKGYDKKVYINEYWLNHISYENYLYNKNKNKKSNMEVKEEDIPF